MLEGAEKMNADIRAWNNGTLEALKSSIESLDIKHQPEKYNRGIRKNSEPSENDPRPSKESLKAKLSFRQGVASKIGINFSKKLIYVHHGVGKGVPAALAGTSATKRQPKDWFNSVIDERIEKLADTVADNMADMTVKNLKIR